MIPPDWLGHYWYGIDDPEDGGRQRLHLWRADSSTVHFAYLSETRSNHGYDLDFAEGTVVAVSDRAITVERTLASEAGWEDMFKEDRNRVSTIPKRGSITIVRVENDRPVLVYGYKELTYKGAEDPADSALFARMRSAAR